MASSALSRLRTRAAQLWQLAKSERATPPEIGWAVGIGAFFGCSPAVFVRPYIAALVATVVKKNRLITWVAAHITSNLIVSPWLTLLEIQLAHRVRKGTWLPLTVEQVADRGWKLLGDWTLGFLFVGTVLGALLGVLGYLAARARDRRALPAPPETPAGARGEDPGDGPLSARTPSPPLPPSSGSRP